MIGCGRMFCSHETQAEADECWKAYCLHIQKLWAEKEKKEKEWREAALQLIVQGEKRGH
jgi:hypothetical protein